MADEVMKLRIDIEPEMDEAKQQKVVEQISGMRNAYASSIADMMLKAEGENDANKTAIEQRGIGLSSVVSPLYAVNDEITKAVQNLGRAFVNVTGEMSAQLKSAFTEPVDIFKHQMSFIADTYNQTKSTQWTNKKVNQIVAAQAYATDYAKRINQMTELMSPKGPNGERSIGSVDAQFFRNFAQLRAAYLAGVEELQHSGKLPGSASLISRRVSDPEVSKVFTGVLSQTLGEISNEERQAYADFLTASSLPFYLSRDTASARAAYIKTPKTATSYGHLPDEYRKIFLQASNHKAGAQPQYPTATQSEMQTMVSDDVFHAIQQLAASDRTGVINELAINAGLVERTGHKLTWRNRGSEAQVSHFAASLPVELEKLKRGGMQYREDPLFTERWNKRSVVVDSAIGQMHELGIVPKLYANVDKASTASFTGKQTAMKALGFPKSYIIPKATLDEKGEFIYNEPTEEAIRVPKGQRAGVERKNQPFVSASDSAMMRMLRSIATEKGYTVDDELGYYTDAKGIQRPFMIKMPLSQLWDQARDENGFFAEGGYDALNEQAKRNISPVAKAITKGTTYNGQSVKFGFLNQEDAFFIPEELLNEYETRRKALGVTSSFQGGNPVDLMKLDSREAFVKQLNNIKSFNTPSHSPEEYYSTRKKGEDRLQGINPQYLNWTALSKVTELFTGQPVGKENILDSLAFVKPGGLFDEGFQGRGAGPILKFAGVLGDLPKTLQESGIISSAWGAGNEAGRMLAPSVALNPENKSELLDLYRYYYGSAAGLRIPQGISPEDQQEWESLLADNKRTAPMTTAERKAFEEKWLFNMADKDIDMFFPDTAVKDAYTSRYLSLEDYKTQTVNRLLSEGKAQKEAEQIADARILERQADMKKSGDKRLDQGLIRLSGPEFKNNLDTAIDFAGGISVVREAGAFETEKNYMPVSMAQSLNLPYSAYAQSMKNYEKMFANWKDPLWVMRHGFAAMPEYQREMELDPDFMNKNEGARSYIQNQVNTIREHLQRGELALDFPGYSALAGMTTGMALDFFTKLTGNKVNANSDVAPLFKSALLDMYDTDKLLKEAGADEAKKAEILAHKEEYDEIRDYIAHDKYFIAPGLKKDDTAGFYKAVSERYPSAWGTGVAGINLYYNPDGTVNQRMAKALEASGGGKDVFYLPSEAMYKMNTGDYDGDTVWSYGSVADEWLQGVENIDKQLADARAKLAERQQQQEANMTKEQKEMIKLTFGEEVARASFLDTYSKSAMGMGSAVIRNALQMPAGPERDQAILEGVQYYDLATSEIKKKGLTTAKLGSAGFSALLVGQNFDRLMRNVYDYSNADEESRNDLHFPSIFKSNIGSVNDITSLGTIAMNQSTARAAGGSFALRKKMSDFVKSRYDMDSYLGQAADWYSGIRIGDLTGEHFVTDDDIAAGYKWLDRLKQEKLTKGSAEQTIYEKEIKALETALKFMESDMSTSQKNIDRVIEEGPNAEGTNSALVKAATQINKNKSLANPSVSAQVRGVLESEKQQEIETKRSIDALQQNEEYKELYNRIFNAPGRHDPNNPKTFPTNYSVTATESWFDRSALPQPGDEILGAQEYSLIPRYGYNKYTDSPKKLKDNWPVSIAYNSDSTFGNYARRVEQEISEIMGETDSVDILLGNYMHKAFEHFWTGEVGKTRKNAHNQEYGTDFHGLDQKQLDEMSRAINDDFVEMLTGKRKNESDLDSNKKPVSFASHLNQLGYNLIQGHNGGLTIAPIPGFAKSQVELNEMNAKAENINHKLGSMISYYDPKTNELVGDEGSIGALIRHIYSRNNSVRVVGIEGDIYDQKGTKLHSSENDRTEYQVGDRTEVTHAKPDVMLELDGKYYILDYKSSRSGAKDSVTQSLLYQSQYEDRAREAHKNHDDLSPWYQLMEEDSEGNLVSKFGGVIGFDAQGKTIIQYSNAHSEWNGKDYIDVLKDQYIKAIQYKREDLENNHYAGAQVELLRRLGDEKLVRYAMENGMLPASLGKINDEDNRRQQRYKDLVNDPNYAPMSSAESDFYIARYAQDKEQLDEIEKALGSEKFKLTRRANPYGYAFDRFAKYRDQIDSLLGDQTLDKMLEVYNNNPEIRNEIREQMTRKSAALSNLAQLRSDYAVEDVLDARRQIMSSIYGIDYDKGGKKLISLYQQLDRAKGTKQGLLSDPELYDAEAKRFRTENDAEIHPGKYKTGIARDIEAARAASARHAENRYTEASKEYDDLLHFVNSVGVDKILKDDKKEGERELQEIIGKPLDLSSVDSFFDKRVNALLTYIRQKEANIEELAKMSARADAKGAAAAQAMAFNTDQLAEARKYLDNPYAFVEAMNAEMGVSSSKATKSTPKDKIDQLYERRKKDAEDRLLIAKEDEATLIKYGFKEPPAPPKPPEVNRFSPYDNQIVSLQRKQDKTRKEKRELNRLITKRQKFFDTQNIEAPPLPVVEDQYKPKTERLTKEQIEAQAQQKKQEELERQKRINANVAKEQPIYDKTMDYLNTWKTQNLSLAADSERISELSLDKLISNRHSGELARLTRIEQAKTLREKLIEATDENGNPIYSMDKRKRLREQYSDEAIENYINNQFNEVERMGALRSDYQFNQTMRARTMNKLHMFGVDRTKIGRGLATYYGGITSAEQRKVSIEQQLSATKDQLSKTDLSKDPERYSKLLGQKEALEKASASATDEISRMTGPLGAADAAVRTLGASFTRLTSMFGRRIFMRLVSEVKQFVKQFQHSLTEIQMITLKSDDQMATLGDSLINKAKELKTSITEISQSAATLYRQGLSDEEVDQRLDVISKFSKVSGTKVADATKLITVAMNTGLVTDPEYAADVVTALGDNAATNAQQIEKGIEKAGAAAAADGTTFAQLAAMLTAITSTTQIGGNVAGRTLNTIFGRMNKIGTNELIVDENGNMVSGSAVAKLLSAQGIKMYDEKGNKRSSYDVLNSLSKKWDNMSDAEQQQIANAIAGTRQYSNFAAIMQGMSEGKVDEYMSLTENASGIVDKKHGIYMESLDASLTNLKNTWDKLVADLTDSGALTGFIDGLAKMVNGVNALTTSFGKLNASLPGIMILLGAIKGASMGGLVGALVGAGLGIATYGILSAAGAEEAPDPHVDRLNRMQTAQIEYSKTVDTQIARAQELKKLGSQRSSAEEEEYNSLLTSLVSILPPDIQQTIAGASGSLDSLAKSAEDLGDAAQQASPSVQEFASTIITEAEKEADKQKASLLSYGIADIASIAATRGTESVEEYKDSNEFGLMVGPKESGKILRVNENGELEFNSDSIFYDARGQNQADVFYNYLADAMVAPSNMAELQEKGLSNWIGRDSSYYFGNATQIPKEVLDEFLRRYKGFEFNSESDYQRKAIEKKLMESFSSEAFDYIPQIYKDMMAPLILDELQNNGLEASNTNIGRILEEAFGINNENRSSISTREQVQNLYSWISDRKNIKRKEFQGITLDEGDYVVDTATGEALAHNKAQQNIDKYNSQFDFETTVYKAFDSTNPNKTFSTFTAQEYGSKESAKQAAKNLERYYYVDTNGNRVYSADGKEFTTEEEARIAGKKDYLVNGEWEASVVSRFQTGDNSFAYSPNVVRGVGKANIEKKTSDLYNQLNNSAFKVKTKNGYSSDSYNAIDAFAIASSYNMEQLSNAVHDANASYTDYLKGTTFSATGALDAIDLQQKYIARINELKDKSFLMSTSGKILGVYDNDEEAAKANKAYSKYYDDVGAFLNRGTPVQFYDSQIAEGTKRAYITPFNESTNELDFSKREYLGFGEDVQALVKRYGTDAELYRYIDENGKAHYGSSQADLFKNYMPADIASARSLASEHKDKMKKYESVLRRYNQINEDGTLADEFGAMYSVPAERKEEIKRARDKYDLERRLAKTYTDLADKNLQNYSDSFDKVKLNASDVVLKEANTNLIYKFNEISDKLLSDFNFDSPELDIATIWGALPKKTEAVATKMVEVAQVMMEALEAEDLALTNLEKPAYKVIKDYFLSGATNSYSAWQSDKKNAYALNADKMLQLLTTSDYANYVNADYNLDNSRVSGRFADIQRLMNFINVSGQQEWAALYENSEFGRIMSQIIRDENGQIVSAPEDIVEQITNFLYENGRDYGKKQYSLAEKSERARVALEGLLNEENPWYISYEARNNALKDEYDKYRQEKEAALDKRYKEKYGTEPADARTAESNAFLRAQAASILSMDEYAVSKFGDIHYLSSYDEEYLKDVLGDEALVQRIKNNIASDFDKAYARQIIANGQYGLTGLTDQNKIDKLKEIKTWDANTLKENWLNSQNAVKAYASGFNMLDRMMELRLRSGETGFTSSERDELAYIEAEYDKYVSNLELQTKAQTSLTSAVEYARLQYADKNESSMAATEIYNRLISGDFKDVTDLTNTVGRSQVDNWTKLLAAAPDLTHKLEELGVKFDESGPDFSNVSNAGEDLASVIRYVAELVGQAGAEVKAATIQTNADIYAEAQSTIEGRTSHDVGFDSVKAILGDNNVTAKINNNLIERENFAALPELAQEAWLAEHNYQVPTSYAGLTPLETLWANGKMDAYANGNTSISTSTQLKGMDFVREALANGNYGAWANMQDQTALSEITSGYEDLIRAVSEAEYDTEEYTKAMSDLDAAIGEKKTNETVKLTKATEGLAHTLAMIKKGGGEGVAALNQFQGQLVKYKRQLDLLDKYRGKSGKEIASKDVKEVAEILGIENEKTLPLMSETGLEKQISDKYDSVFGTVAADMQALFMQDLQDAFSENGMTFDASQFMDLEISFDDAGNIHFDTSGIDAETQSVIQQGVSAFLSHAGIVAQMFFKVLGIGKGLQLDLEATDKTAPKTGGGGGGGKSAVDKLLEQQKRDLAKYAHESKLLEAEYKRLDFENNYPGMDLNIDAQIGNQDAMASAYRDNIAALEAMMAKTKEGSDDWYKLRDAVYEAEEALAEVVNTINELNSKKIEIVQSEMDEIDKFTTHNINMLDKYAQLAMSEDRFMDYRANTESYIASLVEQREGNNEQIAKWQEELASYEENTDAWIEVRDKIWALEEENADLDNTLAQKRLELNQQLLSQISTFVSESSQAATHDVTMAETYGSAFESGGYRSQYEDMIRQQLAGNEQIIAASKAGEAAALERMSELEEGTTAWYEAQAAVFGYQETIAQTTVTQMELNRALQQSKLDSIIEQYSDATAEIGHVNELLSQFAQNALENNDYQSYFRAMNRYLKYLPDQIEEAQTKLAKLQAEYDAEMLAGTLDPAMQRTYLEQIREAESEVLSLQLDQDQKEREVMKTRIDQFTERSDWRTANYEHNQKLLGYETSRYQSRGELTNYGKMLKEDNRLRRGRIKTLDNERIALEKMLKQVKPGSDEEQRLIELIRKTEEAKAGENEQLEKNNKLLEENKQKIRQVRKTLEDAVDKEIEDQKKREREMLSATVSMQETILNVLKKRLQEEWALKKKDIEKEKESLNEYKRLITERFNFRKKASQQANKDEELAEYRRQLALIAADPTRSKDYKEIQRKIEDLEKERSLTVAEDEVAAETQRVDDQIEGLDRFVQYNEELLNEILSDANNFADEINKILSGSFEDSYAKIMEFMSKENEAFMKSLPEAQQQMIQGWEDTWKKANDIIDNNYALITEIIKSKDDYLGYMTSTNREYRELSDEYKKAKKAGNTEEMASIKSRMLYMRKIWSDYYDDYIASTKEDATFTPDTHTLGDVITKVDELKDHTFKVDIEKISGYVQGFALTPTATVAPKDFSTGAAPERVNPPEASKSKGSTGWDYDKHTTTGDWYYKEDGDYVKGQWRQVGGDWFAFDELGKMRVGWFQDTDGKWYYLNTEGGSEEGKMLTGLQEIDGQWSEFDSSGAWLGYKSNKQASGTKHYYAVYDEKGIKTNYVVEASSYDAAKEKLADADINTGGYYSVSQEWYREKPAKGITVNKKGGLVDYTGLAWVDGTKTNPEAFLSATDTANIRSMLDMFNMIKISPYMSQIPDYATNNTTIGDINVTINQAELKTDADFEDVAKRVGQAFSKELYRNGINTSRYAFG